MKTSIARALRLVAVTAVVHLGACERSTPEASAPANAVTIEEATSHAGRLEGARSAVAKRECMIAAVEGGLGGEHADRWANQCASACPMHGVGAIRACVDQQARTLAQAPY